MCGKGKNCDPSAAPYDYYALLYYTCVSEYFGERKKKKRNAVEELFPSLHVMTTGKATITFLFFFY